MKLKCFLGRNKCSFPKKGKYIQFSYTSKKDFIDYNNCYNCGLYYQSNISKLTENQISKFYSKQYFLNGYFKNSKDYLKRKKQYYLDYKYICKYFDDKINKKVLDFGCGNGELLKMFNSKKFGFEFNKDASLHNSVKKIYLKDIKKKILI